VKKGVSKEPTTRSECEKKESGDESGRVESVSTSITGYCVLVLSGRNPGTDDENRETVGAQKNRRPGRRWGKKVQPIESQGTVRTGYQRITTPHAS